MKTTLKILGLSLLTSTILSGCSSADRLAQVGELPKQSEIQNPVMQADYKHVAMPMPVKTADIRQQNSLWSSSNQRAFFEDQRADQIGDILTVTIDVNDEATLKNETSRDRAASDGIGAPTFLGFEGYIDKAFPSTVDPANLAEIESSSAHKGAGEIKREEEIKMQVAAVISEILPNGNMVIHGRQEMRVNYENRILQVSGVIRPEDINIDNTIPYQKIAEARISYGGQGQITDVQQPRYGQQVLDILSPF